MGFISLWMKNVFNVVKTIVTLPLCLFVLNITGHGHKLSSALWCRRDVNQQVCFCTSNTHINPSSSLLLPFVLCRINPSSAVTLRLNPNSLPSALSLFLECPLMSSGQNGATRGSGWNLYGGNAHHMLCSQLAKSKLKQLAKSNG